MSAPTLELSTASAGPDRTKRTSLAEQIALLAGALVALACLAYYLYQIAAYVRFPADLLMWAETDFVGSIIKLRSGQPLYGPPEDSNSLIYTPGPPVVTYLIASVVGGTGSLPVMRTIQLIYVLAAVLLATRNTVLLRRLAYAGSTAPTSPLWMILSFLLLALAATSPEVNRYVYCLHADALALLVSVGAFWALLTYTIRPSRLGLVALVAVPAVGYLTKQFLIAWIGVTFIALAFRDERGAWRKALVVAVLSIVAVAAAVGLCWFLWGDNFLFWTFEVMGGPRSRISFSSPDNIALGRSADHLLQAWPELMIGVVGGIIALRAGASRVVAPLWIGWLAMIAAEAVSSGAGWSVLYHFGPAVVIGTIWLLAALPLLWTTLTDPIETTPALVGQIVSPAIGLAALFTVIAALRAFPTLDPQSARRVPPRQPTPSAYEQVTAIEQEMAGLEPSRVLLDIGNWVYLPENYLAKDRAVSLADQPIIDMYRNFDPLLQRIRARSYEKILVRDLDGMFLYDWPNWRKPSGVRQALLENYTVARVIPPMGPDAALPPAFQFRGAVTVLIPKAAMDAALYVP